MAKKKPKKPSKKKPKKKWTKAAFLKALEARTITFQIDSRAMEALAKLETRVDPGILRARSGVIRRAIIEAAARMEEEEKVRQ